MGIAKRGVARRRIAKGKQRVFGGEGLAKPEVRAKGAEGQKVLGVGLSRMVLETAWV